MAGWSTRSLFVGDPVRFGDGSITSVAWFFPPCILGTEPGDETREAGPLSLLFHPHSHRSAAISRQRLANTGNASTDYASVDRALSWRTPFNSGLGHIFVSTLFALYFGRVTRRSKGVRMYVAEWMLSARSRRQVHVLSFLLSPCPRSQALAFSPTSKARICTLPAMSQRRLVCNGSVNSNIAFIGSFFRGPRSIRERAVHWFNVSFSSSHSS
ncbi:hypothetical protein DFH06DRAFT_1251403 [Mycena polygramma]|nr:hypothetical protein DFH06DRAFT_1251403 [Mycena polygramma]